MFSRESGNRVHVGDQKRVISNDDRADLLARLGLTGASMVVTGIAKAWTKRA